MIDALKEFFQLKSVNGPAPTREAHDHALRVAAGVLLFEVMRADNKVDDSERTVMRTALQSTFDMSADEVVDVMRSAEEHSRTASSIY